MNLIESSLGLFLIGAERRMRIWRDFEAKTGIVSPISQSFAFEADGVDYKCLPMDL